MRRERRGIVLLAWLCFLSVSCKQDEHQNIILDVKAIVNKDPGEVEEILGKPDSTYTLQMMGKSVFCQLYKDTQTVEIQYSKSRATDIVVYETNGLPFDQTALSAFNLNYGKQHPSDYRKGSFMRWSDFEEFSSISFYNAKQDSTNNVMAFDIFFKAKDVTSE